MAHAVAAAGRLGIPVLGTDGSGEDMFTNPDFFFPGQTDDFLPAAVVLAAASFYAHFGFIHSPTDPLHLFVLLKDVERMLRA